MIVSEPFGMPEVREERKADSFSIVEVTFIPFGLTTMIPLVPDGGKRRILEKSESKDTSTKERPRRYL